MVPIRSFEEGCILVDRRWQDTNLFPYNPLNLAKQLVLFSTIALRQSEATPGLSHLQTGQSPGFLHENMEVLQTGMFGTEKRS